MSKIKIDLHEVFRNSKGIDESLNNAFEEAIEYKMSSIEIIHGKGTGQLKKRVLRFLNLKNIKQLYSRIDKDSKNFGRTFVYFKH
jgi:dsDNA-specific endonuclease/ATPase MutS2